MSHINCDNLGESIEVGDKVKIVNNGAHYSTYAKMADLMGAELWDSSLSLKEGSIGEVKSILFHEHQSRKKLALVRLGKREVIMGITGVCNTKLCEKCNNKFKCITHG